jgi:sulfite exporter TauE/SafE
MWGLCYVLVALIAPDIAGLPLLFGGILYASLGIILLAAVGLSLFGTHANFGRLVFFVMGVLMVWAGVESWTGLGLWKVPFENKELFQVSMAAADLLSGASMFFLSLTKDSR